MARPWEDGVGCWGGRARFQLVVAALKFEDSKSDACVCDLGRRQQEKLAATFR